MFRIEVLQNQWLVEALIGGTAFLLVFLLWYVAPWPPRRSGSANPSHKEHEVNGLAESGTSSLPGILLFIYAGTVVCAVAYLIARSFHPPNW